MSLRYRLNEPHVSAEIFDGEVLAINLGSGHYHSIRESGMPIWSMLMQGASVEEILTELAKAWPDETGTQAHDVSHFIANLVAAELVVPVDHSPASFSPSSQEGLPYVPPVLESYTDMQDLLLIDPIHEVDIHTGWPTKLSGQDAL